MYSESRLKLFVLSARLKVQIWLTNHSNIVCSSVTQNMTWELETSPASALAVEFSDAIPGPPNQNLWGWSPGI